MTVNKGCDWEGKEGEDRNTPVDFLGAYEMPVNGIRRGKGGVYRPHNLPIVEAAVSAQDSLLAKYTVSIKKNLGI